MRTFVILGLLVACVAPSAARADCVPAVTCFCGINGGEGPLLVVDVVARDPELTADRAQRVEVRIVDSLGSTATIGDRFAAELPAYDVSIGDLLLMRSDGGAFLRVNESRTEVRCAVDVEQQHFFVTLEEAVGLAGSSNCFGESQHVYPRGTQPPYGCGATGSCSVRPARSETPNAPLAAIALAVVALRRRVKR